MITLQIPLTDELEKGLQKLVDAGIVKSITIAAQEAIKQYIDNMIVEGILTASKEPNITGDLDELIKHA